MTSHDDQQSPPPPWDLRGEAVVAFLPARRVDHALDPSFRRLPGPAVVLGASWQVTPVGPYRELAIVVPSRARWWPGGCVVEMVVDDEASRRGGRANWGMPKQMGRLGWQERAQGPGLRWEDRSIELSVVRRRAGVPCLVAFPLVQARSDGPIVAPGVVMGRAHPAWVEVEVPAGDPLGRIAGRRPGLHLTGLRLHLRPGRRTTGMG